MLTTCSKISWSHMIITNDSLDHVPEEMQDLIQKTLPEDFVEITDFSGLTYPKVKLHIPYGTAVERVVMRIFKDTAYVVEVTVYRTWLGSDTTGAHTASCGVSMYNIDWDTNMNSLEDIRSRRNWSPSLKEFFPASSRDSLQDGFDSFLDRVRTISTIVGQSLIHSMTRELCIST